MDIEKKIEQVETDKVFEKYEMVVDELWRKREEEQQQKWNKFIELIKHKNLVLWAIFQDLNLLPPSIYPDNDEHYTISIGSDFRDLMLYVEKYRTFLMQSFSSIFGYNSLLFINYQSGSRLEDIWNYRLDKKIDEI